MNRRTGRLVISLAVAGLVGCGGSDRSDEDAIREVAVEWVVATTHGDGEAACDLLTPAGEGLMRRSFKDLAATLGVPPERPTGPLPSCPEVIKSSAHLSLGGPSIADQAPSREEVEDKAGAIAVSVSSDGTRARAELDAAEPDSNPLGLQKTDGEWLISDFGASSQERVRVVAARQQIMQLLGALNMAVDSSDTRMLCTEVLPPDFDHEAERTCARAVATAIQADPRRLPLLDVVGARDIAVTGATATVDTSGRTLHFVREKGRWSFELPNQPAG